jgi:acetyl-CoA synthetase
MVLWFKKETGELEIKRICLRKSIHIWPCCPIAKLDKIQFVSGLPKHVLGKIMRRILRKKEGDFTNFGISVLY